MILIPFNYHERKAKIGIVFRSRGLYSVTMALENDPNVVVEKAKWHNRMDEAYGLLCLSISPYLLFHLYGLTTPNQVCTELESLFGVQKEIRANQLENELISLSPRMFEPMEGFFTKFKSLILILKQCGIKKKEDQLIFSILSKVGS